MTDHGQEVREWADRTKEAARLTEIQKLPAGGTTEYRDLQKAASALLALLDKGNERFKQWRIHKNDSPELGQEMWQEVIDAVHAALGLNWREE